MITINQYKFADIGFYINLDSRTDRKDKLESQLRDYNIRNVIRHSANTETSSGPQNCKSSHYQIYRKFLDTEYETLLVLEDDCLFLPYLYSNTEEVYNNIFSLNFDLFWLGCRNRRSPKLYKNKCYQVQSVSHAQSYIINRKLCEYILNFFPEHGHNSLAIDELLCLVPFGYDVAYDPNKFNFYEMDNPLEQLEQHFLSLCYERALTTQYQSYSDLWHTEANYEYYLSSSFPVVD
jgi:GR25 family glycosyltransferase involved in LPS biosynthesis